MLAGILFGGSLVFAMAFLLHDRPLRLPVGKVAGFVGAVMVSVYTTHLYYSYDTASQRYATSIPPVVLEPQRWLETDWQQLPRSRILLDGDMGEPILIQTDLPLADIIGALTSSGWTLQDSSRLDSLLNAILPSKGTLSTHLARPLTNSGRSPAATLVKLHRSSNDERIALRIWEANFVLADERRSSPVLMISATAERLNPILFDFSLVDVVGIRRPDRAKIASNVVAALPGRLSLKVSDRPVHVVTSRAAADVTVAQ